MYHKPLSSQFPLSNDDNGYKLSNSNTRSALVAAARTIYNKEDQGVYVSSDKKEEKI